jgi:hypothetical protein
MDYTGQVDAHLLHGCCREADRADLVALNLEGLKQALPDTFHGHMTAVTEGIHASSRLLRDLADRSQVHFARVPVMLNYLNIILPCLCRSLRDITTYYEDKTVSKEIRWRKMYHKMTEEVGGLPLPLRFQLYNHFLALLRLLLTRCVGHQLDPWCIGALVLMILRSPNFDLNQLEALRGRILQLRESRGIGESPGLGQDVGPRDKKAY